MLSSRGPGLCLVSLREPLALQPGCLEAGGTAPHPGRARGAPAARRVRRRAGESARRLERKEEANSFQVWVRIAFPSPPYLFKPSMVSPFPAHSSCCPFRTVLWCGKVRSGALEPCWPCCTRVEQRDRSLSTAGWEFVFGMANAEAQPIKNGNFAAVLLMLGMNVSVSSLAADLLGPFVVERQAQGARFCF